MQHCPLSYALFCSVFRLSFWLCFFTFTLLLVLLFTLSLSYVLVKSILSGHFPLVVNINDNDRQFKPSTKAQCKVHSTLIEWLWERGHVIGPRSHCYWPRITMKDGGFKIKAKYIQLTSFFHSCAGLYLNTACHIQILRHFNLSCQISMFPDLIFFGI